MKHYTETIPVALAEKLKEKGIHQLKDNRMEGWLNSGNNITYAEVFDWLMEEKKLYVSLLPTWDSPSDGHLNYEYQITELNVPFKEFKDNVSYSWCGAANAAIKKCLELI